MVDRFPKPLVVVLSMMFKSGSDIKSMPYSDKTFAGLKEIARDGLYAVVVGDCMGPVIFSGNMIYFRPEVIYFPGDIVVRKGKNGYMAHRVLGFIPSLSGFRYVTQGDNNSFVDAVVRERDILGKISIVENSELAVSANKRLLALSRCISYIVMKSMRRGESALER